MKNRPAELMAGLAIGSFMVSSAVFANDTAVSLPQTAQAPVSMMQPIRLDGAPEDMLQVFVGPVDSCCDGKTPVAGNYAHENDVLSFTPAFGFSEGEDYVVRIAHPQGTQLIPFSLAVDAATVPAAVTEIYPSGDELPENILRFYVHFSLPMRPSVAFDFIKLRDANGIVDDAAFMRFKQELWNEDRTRLTVLMDPGRIKRNVATNVELGPALLEGREYTLSVDAGWAAANGRSILAAFEKRFIVTAPLRKLPEVSNWRIATPCVGTREPLLINFDRPFDRHLLSQDIRVSTEGGQKITGEISVGEGERSWAFIPDAQWPNEQLHLDVSPTLEDVAANNFHDLLDQVANSAATSVESVTLPISQNDCSN